MTFTLWHSINYHNEHGTQWNERVKESSLILEPLRNCINLLIRSITFRFEDLINSCCAVIICDMIKRNESDVGFIAFEILANTVFKFLCFILFLALSNPS